MSVILALALRPDDRLMARFERLYAGFMSLYDGISIVTPPDVPQASISTLQAKSSVKVLVGSEGFENRRYRTIDQALTFPDVEHVHYCDGDHALSRFERFPNDWRDSVAAMQNTDCLIIGRSAEIFDSYPQALRDTEKIINMVGSYLLGQPVDLGSGTRGFSRDAAAYIIEHSSPQSHPIAVDSEWPVMLHRAGFSITTYESHGAIYEVPNEATRARLEHVVQWMKRVNIAHRIIEAGIHAAGGVTQ